MYFVQADYCEKYMGKNEAMRFQGAEGADMYRLAIPNLEIRQIFVEQIQEWFQEEARKDTLRLDVFCAAFLQGDADAVEKQITPACKRPSASAIRQYRMQRRKTGISKDRGLTIPCPMNRALCINRNHIQWSDPDPGVLLRAERI